MDGARGRAGIYTGVALVDPQGRALGIPRRELLGGRDYSALAPRHDLDSLLGRRRKELPDGRAGVEKEHPRGHPLHREPRPRRSPACRIRLPRGGRHTTPRARRRGPLLGAPGASPRGGFRQHRPRVEAFVGRQAAARPRTLSPLPAPAVSKLTLSPAWKALAAHRKKIAAANLADLFAADPSRAERFLIEAGGLVLDYSKHRVDAEAMRLLAGLAAQAQLPRWIASMFAGDPLNSTEARANAARARAWLASALGNSNGPSRHFAAVTANPAGAEALGVPPERVFPMWDWVGGRYSVWSAVGLPVALAAGMSAFEELLHGARAMDAHFRNEPLELNMPVVLALLEIWYVNFFGAQTRAVIPYSEDLRDLPAYLQQLEMESNGKRVDRDGNEVDYATAPVVWGASGTPSQHSFHQLLHQGTHLIPVDFIVIGRNEESSAEQGALVANALAQSAALAYDKPAPDSQYKALPGNRPSSTVLLERLTPRALGALIALHEHKVFAEGVIWNLNSCDQWAVEHGKNLARTLLPRLLEGGDTAGLDASTRGLFARLRNRD